jgi:tRNA threonylcarbamoyl adenosine modification protein (Sua5/YciO/YrdC/YwlC family)
MNTRIVKLEPLNPEADYLKETAGILRNGGLVIMPTETVYGIAANMLNNETLRRLYEIKKRPIDKPFSLHIAEKGKIEEFAKEIPTSAYKLIDKFWPGPLTLILNSKDAGKIGTSTLLSANGEQRRTIGLRMPDNEIALKVISQAGVPIVCPSANISGRPAPINFEEAIKDLNNLVDFAIDAGATKLRTESSVVDLTVLPPQVLREGAIKKADVEEAIKKKAILFICTGNSCRSVMAEALLEEILKEKNRDDVEVVSAGIMMLEGLGATEETKEALRKEGIDVSSHRSQRVTKDMLRKSDIILVMENLHEKRILEIDPEVNSRLFLLKEFANSVRSKHFINLEKIPNGTKISNNNLDIADPIGKPIEFYENTLATIKQAVERISNII